jgi:hypothetical protein
MLADPAGGLKGAARVGKIRRAYSRTVKRGSVISEKPGAPESRQGESPRPRSAPLARTHVSGRLPRSDPRDDRLAIRPVVTARYVVHDAT